jgi:hypothetical protein
MVLAIIAMVTMNVQMVVEKWQAIVVVKINAVSVESLTVKVVK